MEIVIHNFSSLEKLRACLPDSKQIMLLMMGLPGSGKSTIAEQLMQTDARFKRVSRDHLRDMLDMGRYSPVNEDLVKRVQEYTITEILFCGFNVIVDNTNLNLWDRRDLVDLADYQVHTTVFTMAVSLIDAVSVEECISRDSLRPKPVGEKVIQNMWEKWLRQNNQTMDK